jgi:hypothetical protein
MRILLVESDAKKAEEILDYAKNGFGLLRDCKPEYIVANHYDWQYLAGPCSSINWRKGEFDAVVITSITLQDEEYSGQFGLVMAAEAAKRNLPCVIVLPSEEVWMFPFCWNISARTIATNKYRELGFDLHDLMIALCEELEKKGIDYN